MFGSTARSASAYASAGVETGVAVASPHTPSKMPHRGTLITAMFTLNRTKAKRIVDTRKPAYGLTVITSGGPRARLGRKIGGHVSGRFESLSRRMSNRLLTARLQNEPVTLKEAHAFLPI